MKGNRFILLIALAMISCFFAGMDSMAQAASSNHPALASMEAVRDLVDHYESAGELGHPLVMQLRNRLDQAKHQLEKGSIDQAINMMEDFLKHLNNQGMQKLISPDAKLHLEEAVHEVIEQLTEPSVTIVQNGEAGAAVIIAPNASEKIQDAAQILVEYVRKSTGAELPILTSADDADAADKVHIYVGIAAPGEEGAVISNLEGLLEDGYFIHPTASTITIIGPKEIGTEYGVYEFLERYVGVRWLMPGDYGEDVPQHTDLKIPWQDVRDEPVYMSRNMFPLHYENAGGNNPTNYEWGVRNRIRNQNNGWDHYIWHMFPPSEYLEEYPEFYPHPNGYDQPAQIPSPYYGWQICYSNEDTIPFAVNWIIDYFNNNPDVPSVSLAVNDSGNYCEQHPYHEHYTSETNSIGLPHMSDIYFAWVNKVVEQVLEVHPDKWFGVLAYQEVYDPPSFPLHERVVPYLTKDRMSWIDDEVRAEDQAIVERWKEKANHIGFYDYIYSNPYVLPRVYNHHMADVLKYGSENNVAAFFGEANPNWGTGPKSWVLAKLMWNPNQDVEALENEWYERAVGAEAAPYLKAYFDHWTDFWENRIQETDWFQSRKRIVYFMFDSAAYLSIVSDEEIAQSREWLETAVAKASTEQQRVRAEVILRQFEYYEASALSYPKEIDPLTNAEDALELLEQSVDFQMRMDYAEKRLVLIDEFENDPVMRHASNPRNLGMVWSGLNGAAFREIVNYVVTYEPQAGPVRERIAFFAEHGSTEGIKNYARLLQSVLDGEPINLNASFEEPTEEDHDQVNAKHWEASILNYGKFDRKEENPYSGEASIYLHHFYFGSIHQTVDVTPGLILTQLKYYVTEDTETVGTVWLELVLLDDEGNPLETIQTGQVAFSNSLGRWATIELMDQIPEEIQGVPVKQVRMEAVINGFWEGGTMYLDDFVLYQANDQ